MIVLNYVPTVLRIPKYRFKFGERRIDCSKNHFAQNFPSNILQSPHTQTALYWVLQ